jgi:hypothetical protein
MPAIPGIKTNTAKSSPANLDLRIITMDITDTTRPSPPTVLQFAPFLNPAIVKEQP